MSMYMFDSAPDEEATITPSEAGLIGEIAKLKSDLDFARDLHQRSQTLNVEYANKVDEFGTRLMEAHDNSEIDNDLAKEFADIFDLELSKVYTISLTASWSGSVTVPFGESVDDLEFDFPFPELSYSCGDYELDIDEDETDFTVNENY